MSSTTDSCSINRGPSKAFKSLINQFKPTGHCGTILLVALDVSSVHINFTEDEKHNLIFIEAHSRWSEIFDVPRNTNILSDGCSKVPYAFLANFVGVKSGGKQPFLQASRFPAKKDEFHRETT